MDTRPFKHRLLGELEQDIVRYEQDVRTGGQVEVHDFTEGDLALQGTTEALRKGVVAAQTLQQVQDALRRIEEGIYGVCLGCGCQIPMARLRAEPWAPYGLEDQKSAIKRRQWPLSCFSGKEGWMPFRQRKPTC